MRRLLICLAMAVPLHAQDSVRVDSAALDTLRAGYTAHVERAYCITAYHVEQLPNGSKVPVIDRVSFAGQGDSLSVEPPKCFSMHTHPPDYPKPAGMDVGVMLTHGWPFCAIQYGPTQFSSWNAM